MVAVVTFANKELQFKQKIEGRGQEKEKKGVVWVILGGIMETGEKREEIDRLPHGWIVVATGIIWGLK